MVRSCIIQCVFILLPLGNEPLTQPSALYLLFFIGLVAGGRTFAGLRAVVEVLAAVDEFVEEMAVSVVAMDDLGRIKPIQEYVLLQLAVAVAEEVVAEWALFLKMDGSRYI